MFRNDKNEPFTVPCFISYRSVVESIQEVPVHSDLRAEGRTVRVLMAVHKGREPAGKTANLRSNHEIPAK